MWVTFASLCGRSDAFGTHLDTGFVVLPWRALFVQAVSLCGSHWPCVVSQPSLDCAVFSRRVCAGLGRTSPRCRVYVQFVFDIVPDFAAAVISPVPVPTASETGGFCLALAIKMAPAGPPLRLSSTNSNRCDSLLPSTGPRTPVVPLVLSAAVRH